MVRRAGASFPVDQFLQSGGIDLLADPGKGQDSELSVWKKRQWQRFQEMGLPTTRVEEWRYTDLSSLARRNLRLATGAQSSTMKPLGELDRELKAFKEKKVQLGLAGPVLVFINGKMEKDLSTLTELSDTLSIQSLDHALNQYPSRLKQLDNFLSVNDDAWARLNGAVWTDGLWLEVKPGTRAATPLWIFHWSQPGAESELRSTRMYLNLGPRSELKLVQYFAGSPFEQGSSSMNFSSVAQFVFDVDIQQGARLQHIQVQKQPEWIDLFCQLRGEVDRDAHLEEFVLGKSLGRSRIETLVDLNGENSEAQFNSVCISEGEQHFDQRSLVRHKSPQTRSAQVSKSVVGGRAQASFNGKIYIARDAQMVESLQLNKNLLLSKTAQVHSKPELEVHADNVKANHGSATGQLSAEQLFYLTSRGIRPAAAKALLVEGFTKELVDRLSDEELRVWVHSELKETFQ